MENKESANALYESVNDISIRLGCCIDAFDVILTSADGCKVVTTQHLNALFAILAQMKTLSEEVDKAFMSAFV